jgi:hypothetical protein
MYRHTLINIFVYILPTQVRYKSSPYDDRLRREFVDLYNLSIFGTKNIRAAMLAIGIEPRNEDDDDEEERTPITTAAIEVLHECKKEVDIDDFDDEEDEQEIADDDDDDEVTKEVEFFSFVTI